MAYADLRDKLMCIICSNFYSDPASLKCGHSFCRDCIVTALDTQEGSGFYACPECKKRYTQRPTLEKNRKLCNIVECFLSSPQKEIEVFCTYCDSPTPAIRTCLLCEASFCEKHLSNHSRSAHHILIEPTASVRERQCSIHQEILKYYCTEDSDCICMSCWVAGEHRGHHVELLNEASEKMKEKLRESINIMDSERQEIQGRICNLDSHKTQEDMKNIAVSGRVTELFRDLRRHLDDLEKRVQIETSRQNEKISLSVSYLIQQLEEHKDVLSIRIDQSKELCDIEDSLMFLKKAPSRKDIFSGTDDTTNDARTAGCIIEEIISEMLQKGLCSFTQCLKDLITKGQFSLMKKSGVVLDVSTAHETLRISEKQKRASNTDTDVDRPDGLWRLKCFQVLSVQKFTSGTHYWEVDVMEAEEWLIGVVTASTQGNIPGTEVLTGYDNKSWTLSQIASKLHFRHGDTSTNIDSESSLKTVGIYLEYEAGRLSFFQLCDPIRHLHTFTTTFTEPLHAAFYVFPKSSIRIIT